MSQHAILYHDHPIYLLQTLFAVQKFKLSITV